MVLYRRRVILASAASIALVACTGAAPGRSVALVDITTAPIGQPKGAVAAWLAARRIHGGQAFGQYVIYETPVFERVFDRQRLVLTYAEEALEQVHVIVTPAFWDEAARTFQDVFHTMLAAYGRPSFSSERGAFTAELGIDLSTGRFRRQHDWRVPAGDLRMSIPQRLDRQVRIEIQFAPRLRHSTQSDWSIEAIR